MLYPHGIRENAQCHSEKLPRVQICLFNSSIITSNIIWTLRTDRDQILAFEMYCYRRLQQINWTQEVTNAEFRKRQNIKQDLIQEVVRRKLGLFGHECRK